MAISRQRTRRLSKGENANIPTPPPAECLDGDDRGDESEKADGDMSDEGKKPWETDDASKADDDDEDEDAGAEGDDDTSKADDDEDEDEDDDEKDGDSASKSARFRRDLQKAIKSLARYGELHDPAVRKEALMAKALKGGGLNKSENTELVGLLQGRADSGLRSAVQTAQSPGPALRKSMVENRAMAEAYDNVTKSLHAQARFIDETAKVQEETNFAMARLLTKSMKALACIYDRQEALVGAVEGLARQPVAGPRSHGVRWSEKSFAGDPGAGATYNGKGSRISKASPVKVREVLKSLAKSHGPRTQSGQAFQLAAEGLLMNKPLMPSIEAAVEEHLSQAAG